MALPSGTLQRMKSAGIDSRDAEWEIPNPRYRVDFHDAKGASDDEVEGADVTEVLAWPREGGATGPSSSTLAHLAADWDCCACTDAIRTTADRG